LFSSVISDGKILIGLLEMIHWTLSSHEGVVRDPLSEYLKKLLNYVKIKQIVRIK
jgi:hypothetical protein